MSKSLSEGLRERWKNHKVIVARDKVDNIRGIKHKLLGYEKFLKPYLEMIGKVVLVQVCLSNKIETGLPDLTAGSIRSNKLPTKQCFFRRAIMFPSQKYWFYRVCHSACRSWCFCSDFSSRGNELNFS